MQILFARNIIVDGKSPLRKYGIWYMALCGCISDVVFKISGSKRLFLSKLQVFHS